MKIPHTVPKVILRAYARELTPEQLQAEYEGRVIRSEDATWDVDVGQNIAEQALTEVIQDYPMLVERTRQFNSNGEALHKAAFDEWQKARDNQQHKGSILTDLTSSRRATLEDDDDDHSVLTAEVSTASIEPQLPESFPHFEPSTAVLDRLTPSDRMHAIEELDFKVIPLKMAVETIPDQHYWERAALDRWPWANKYEHGENWRRVFMEKHATDAIEKFHPFEHTMEKLILEIQDVAPEVVTLKLQNLIPNCYGFDPKPKVFKPFKADEDLAGEEDEGFSAVEELKRLQQQKAKATEEEEEQTPIDDIPLRTNDHLDFTKFIGLFTGLKKLSIVYEMQSQGMDWEARFTEFTDTDVEVLAQALKTAPILEHLELVRSRMTRQQCRTLVRSGISKMTKLKILNLSYNSICNGGAKAIARMLTMSPVNSTLWKLVLARNNIKNKGAKALAFALTRNDRLMWLDLRLNHIEDSGGMDFGHALVSNATLQHLNLAANRLTQGTAFVLGKMLKHNEGLLELDVSSNKLERKGGEHLAKGLEYNFKILKLDTRLCQTGLQCEYQIDLYCRRNRTSLPHSLLDRDDILPPRDSMHQDLSTSELNFEGEEDGFETEEDDEEEVEESTNNPE